MILTGKVPDKNRRNCSVKVAFLLKIRPFSEATVFVLKIKTKTKKE